MAPRTDDPTMELMRQTAEHLGRAPALPLSLDGATLREANEKRAALLNEIGNIIEADLRAAQGAAPDPYDIPPQVPLLATRLEGNKGFIRLERILFDGERES